MAKGKCRECKKCTKSLIGKIISAPKSAVTGAVNVATLGALKKKCPVCGHSMKHHKSFGK